MVNARLHIICGNCGSNEFLSFEIVPNDDKDKNSSSNNCYIHCENCSTIHNLESNIPMISDKKE